MITLALWAGDLRILTSLSLSVFQLSYKLMPLSEIVLMRLHPPTISNYYSSFLSINFAFVSMLLNVVVSQGIKHKGGQRVLVPMLPIIVDHIIVVNITFK